MPVVRTLASRTIANASGRISFKTSCSRYFRSSLSRASLTASATWALKKAVRSRNCSSESFLIEGSNSLILAMAGRIDFKNRSLLLPKTLVKTLSIFMMTLRVQSSTFEVVLTYARKKREFQTQFEIVRERGVANQARSVSPDYEGIGYCSRVILRLRRLRRLAEGEKNPSAKSA